jgi:glucan phosphoethanolaminetransferase (alkaline phosphatase superfamily)
LYIADLNISEGLLLLSIFFMLSYFWFKSENWRMTALIAMLLMPYTIVVIVLYTLPLYITNVDILAFVQIIFLIISLIVVGYTIEDYRVIKKSKK